MKFNLSAFLQLDTKGLLAVNGGYNCNGSTNTTVYSNTYYPSGGNTTPNGGGSSGDNLTYTTRDNKDGTITKTGWLNGKSVIIDHLDSKTGEKVCPTQYPYGYYPTNNGNNSSKNSNSSSGGGSCSTPSSSPDSSSGKSNNPNGQGPSTTSSNPGKDSGDKGKKEDTPHTGGTCPGTGGGTHIPPSDDDSGTGDGGTDIPNGGGICGGTGGSGEGEKPNTDGGEITNPDDPIDKTSGLFGQITDGSYADLLTMQFYKNNGDEYSDINMYGTHKDKKTEQIVDNKFSEVGCKEAAATKIIAEFEKSTYIDMTAVQYFCDSNLDGDLSATEIAAGINKMLDSAFDDKYDVKCRDIEENIDIDTLKGISNKKDGEETYVLGFAPDCWGGHWVVLEGYTQNPDGVISFDYDGTSDNDRGRTYVLGKDTQDKDTNTWGITRIQTFTIYQK